MNQLDALKTLTTVVADTGSFRALAPYAPREATTNPTLILQAVQQPDYAPLLAETLAARPKAPLPVVADALLVRFGCEILKVVPGRVSTEVDARLSFDTAAMIARAHHLIECYERAGVARKRVLVKVAATWEGIQAARALEHEGVHCNLTLLFALCQAVACGEAGVTVVSPFVGRIHDWHRQAAGQAWSEAANAGIADPGVRAVRDIWRYYKHFDVATQVMGASLRSVGQILALAGCDLLTISPELLGALQAGDGPVPRRLDVAEAKAATIRAVTYNEAAFRYALNDDAMAADLLSDGIRRFAADAARLDQLIEARR